MSDQNHSNSQNQFQLLRKKRFGPFFLTQFFGAFNDNVFKNALFILIAFQSDYSGSSNSNTIINLAAILFILPFFLFSATAGQIADRFEKSRLIRRIKLAEIGIMLLAAVGFYFKNIPLLLIALFLMGSQSSLFGPIKYSIIPQHLKKEETCGRQCISRVRNIHRNTSRHYAWRHSNKHGYKLKNVSALHDISSICSGLYEQF